MKKRGRTCNGAFKYEIEKKGPNVCYSLESVKTGKKTGACIISTTLDHVEDIVKNKDCEQLVQWLG